MSHLYLNFFLLKFNTNIVNNLAPIFFNYLQFSIHCEIMSFKAVPILSYFFSFDVWK